MKKEIDTYKLDELFKVFKNALITAWYLSGMVICAALWYFPLPESHLQVFSFAGAFVMYSAMSICVAKLEAIRTELK